jgi:hypothetical protein
MLEMIGGPDRDRTDDLFHATKIVMRETVNADSLGILFHRIPDYIACDTSILPNPIL